MVHIGCSLPHSGSVRDLWSGRRLHPGWWEAGPSRILGSGGSSMTDSLRPGPSAASVPLSPRTCPFGPLPPARGCCSQASGREAALSGHVSVQGGHRGPGVGPRTQGVLPGPHGRLPRREGPQEGQGSPMWVSQSFRREPCFWVDLPRRWVSCLLTAPAGAVEAQGPQGWGSPRPLSGKTISWGKQTGNTGVSHTLWGQDRSLWGMGRLQLQRQCSSQTPLWVHISPLGAVSGSHWRGQEARPRLG